MTPTPAGSAPPRRGDLQLVLNAAGRVGRLTYVAAMAPVVLALRLPALVERGPAHVAALWILWSAALVVGCTLTAKRLHDAGFAGWWTAAVMGVIVTGLVAPEDGALEVAASWLLAIALAVLVLWPGQPRFNRFGPVPEGIWPPHAKEAA